MVFNVTFNNISDIIYSMAACNKETLQILKLTSQGYISLLQNLIFISLGIFLYTIQIWLDSIDNFCMYAWLDSISNFCIQT